MVFSPFIYIIYVFQQSARTCNPFATKKFRSVFITGASSGIGREFALQMAGDNVTLFLAGRNRSKLQSIKAACEKKHSEVYFFVVDVSNAIQISNCILECDNLRSLDLIFANAGIGFPTCKSNNFIGRFYEMFDCNIIGTINTIFPIIPRFLSRKSGHIVINSSLASYVNKPQVTSYSMTKVFLRFFAEMLRLSLKSKNINVTIVNPGYVQTPLIEGYKNSKKTAKIYEKALPVDKAVSQYIIDGIKRNKYTIDFPNIVFTLVLWLSGLHPIIRVVIGSFLINKNECDKEFHELGIKQSIQQRLEHYNKLQSHHHQAGSGGGGDINSSSGLAPHLTSMDDKFKFSITQPGAISTLGGNSQAAIVSQEVNDNDIGIELGQNMGLEEEKEQFIKENNQRQILIEKEQDSENEKENENKNEKQIEEKQMEHNRNPSQSQSQSQSQSSDSSLGIVSISPMHASGAMNGAGNNGKVSGQGGGLPKVNANDDDEEELENVKLLI